MGKLFLYGDLKELPVVKNVIEENKCKMALTEERWFRVTDALPDAVAELGKLIEMDCEKTIKDAARQASRADGLRFYIDNNDDQREIEEDQDCIPTCLLSAAAIFKHDDYRCSIFDGYTEILRKRTTTPLYSWTEPHSAWGEGKINSTGAIVTTASLLLEHLRLPKETTMSYMLACGCDFRCLRCSRISGKLSMTWLQLVSSVTQGPNATRFSVLRKVFITFAGRTLYREIRGVRRSLSEKEVSVLNSSNAYRFTNYGSKGNEIAMYHYETTMICRPR